MEQAGQRRAGPRRLVVRDIVPEPVAESDRGGLVGRGAGEDDRSAGYWVVAAEDANLVGPAAPTDAAGVLRPPPARCLGARHEGSAGTGMGRSVGQDPQLCTHLAQFEAKDLVRCYVVMVRRQGLEPRTR
jgi:hypothetical protein